ncbi:MAG TPA: alpha-2-macroglobulin family protein [Pyrinomonadaceae bacterium]|jgi:hypothetical protein
MSKLKRAVAWLLVVNIFVAGLPKSQAAPVAASETREALMSESATDETSSAAEEERRGLQFRLSEGAEQAEAASQANRVVAATRLSESATEAVLRRLPPLKVEAGDAQEFALRERSLPRPRTGATINNSFPAPEQTSPREQANTGALEVVRYSPEGDVPLAPQLSVSFSQPMVAVTSQDEAAKSVPVQLSPQVKGKWRWIGTKTLLFEADERLPMATHFKASVPAGTKSANGATLGAARSWTFSTPPPQLQSHYPSDQPVRRDAIIFLSFDQRINPSDVLRSVKLQAGTTQIPVRLATMDEINADSQVRPLVKNATEGRWLAVRALNPSTNDARLALPPDSAISVTLLPGTPSAEGSRTTEKPQSFSFRTYGAFKIVSHECGYQKCTPGDAWRITFSNPIDAEAFDKSQIRVEPEFPAMQPSVHGNQLYIQGYKRGRTTYRVTFDAGLRDQFGQTLGQHQTVSFNVGAADPSLSSLRYGFTVLDPSAQPRYSVFSINHASLRVKLYRVGVEDWEKFSDYMRYMQGYADASAPKQTTPPGRLVYEETVAVASKPDELVETRIDLRPAFNAEGLGHAVVVVEPVKDPTPAQRRYRMGIRSWVQSTRIGLDAFMDNTELLGWTTSLQDGRPLEGVEMSLYPLAARAVSGADGLARFALPAQSKGLRLLVARKGSDTAILPEHLNWYDKQSYWYKKSPPADSLRWYVFDDRAMYRPGEEVHVKGWLRRVGNSKLGDLAALGGAASSLAYTLIDSRGNEIKKGALQLNAFGGFDTSFKLPATMNLGHAQLTLVAQGGDAGVGEREHAHAFQVQEFRRPEFEVSTSASEGPHLVGGHADASVTASYYAGGGLPNAEVNWSVTSTPGSFTPPNRGDYTFGTWVPWWRTYYGDGGRETQTRTFSGRTDAAGKHRLRIDFDSVKPARPSNVAASASITDVNRQAWTSTTNLLVHPADLYVGLKSDRTFVQRGQPLVVQSIVADLDGKLVANREIRMRAVRLEWVFRKGQWKQEETSPQECNVRSATEAVRCTFQTKEGGVYRVAASVYDDRERRNESELTLWVAGGRTPPNRDITQESVELIPDRKEFLAGETAEVLVQSPFAPAEGVVTLRRSGIVRTERFRMESTSHTLRIPIEDAFTPNVHLQVDLVGAAARTDEQGQPDAKLPARPAFASGTLNLPVPPHTRKLRVTATPRDKSVEPGGETTVELEVKDAQGRPVAGSEMAVVVVDEAVLSLTSYRLPDPLEIFYQQRAPGVSDHHLRANVLLGNTDDLTGKPFARLDSLQMELRGVMQADALGMAGGGASETVEVTAMTSAPANAAVNGRRARAGKREMRREGELTEDDAVSGAAIRMRENFNALAVFAPALPTDAQGRARVNVKVPDNLTRYRVMAVSVAGSKQFGSGESSITARMPLMVRPSAPRFLNFGDQFELPVVIQNQTDSQMSVDVAVRSANAELTEGAGRRVNVPANDRVEVRFPVAASQAGVARFQMGAASGRWADAAEIQLPVWTPATTEAFATYGELDQAGAILQPVKAPPDVFKQFGGLEITTSSTQLQELTDALLYLMAYPYECSEQMASRVLAVAALRDVLTAFKAKNMPSPEEMQSAVMRDLKRLQSLQNNDGGFAFWRRGDDSWPYVSIHVAHALQRAKEKNFDVPSGMLDKSKGYLKRIEQHIPAHYSLEARRALIAYALYVRNRTGDRDAARAQRLINEAGVDKLSLEALGWLLPVISKSPGAAAQVEAIHKLLGNRVTETAAAAHFSTSYSDGEYLLLHSDRRADAVILEALINERPQSDLIPKLVRGLLGHRSKGRWSNTQENVFVLLALDRYFNTYEKTTPNFVARAWVGDTHALQREFRGRSTERQHVEVPMRLLAERPEAQQALTLSKEGAGRLYYRIGMQYAPRSLKLDAADYGFTVERTYEAIDNPSDVRRDSDGTWRIKAGAKVRVRLTLAAPARRHHVALVDPMPAGLEALNPSLATTGPIPQDPQEAQPALSGGRRRGGWWWWNRTWFEHQNFRDERAEAFTSLLWEGVYNYSYVARATTPGLFVVPPPKAEEMYHPETFGRGSTDRVRIE